VELSSGEAHKSVERIDFRGLGVHKKPDGLDARREFRAYCGSFNRGNAAKAFLVEIEAEHVGACVAGGYSVRPIGDAADFDEDHGRLHRKLGAAQKSSESGRGIGREHETFADQESIEAGFLKFGEIVVRAEAGFADGDAGVGNALD